MDAPTILWDWNGTLLDDTESCVGALNAILSRRDLPSVDIRFFRTAFSFPARSFYSICGIKLENEDWDALALEYHREYLSRPAGLAADAVAALDAADAAGSAQYILSAMRQDLLDAAIADCGLAGRFKGVVGSGNLDGAGKMETARKFAATLGFAPPARRLVLIGDSLHDAEVAAGIGAKCVLYSGGTHSPERLAVAGPVASSLCEAVAIALEVMEK